MASLPAIRLVPRHARPCAGHPRLSASAKSKTWMAGTSPAMTTWAITAIYSSAIVTGSAGSSRRKHRVFRLTRVPWASTHKASNVSSLYPHLEHDGFELNRRKHLVYLAPLAGRGRNSLREFRVRGPIRESDLVERPPHPGPLPARGAREKVVRRLNLNSSCSSVLVLNETRGLIPGSTLRV